MTTISRLSFVFAATSALITASQAFAQTRALNRPGNPGGYLV